MTGDSTRSSRFVKGVVSVVVIVSVLSVGSFVLLSSGTDQPMENNGTMESNETVEAETGVQNEALTVETAHAEGRVSTLYARGNVTNVSSPSENQTATVEIVYSLEGEQKWATAWSGTVNQSETVSAAWEPSQGCLAGGTRYDVRVQASTETYQTNGSVVTVSCGHISRK